MDDRNNARGGKGKHRDTSSAWLEAMAGRLVRLTAKQQKAVALILSGFSMADVADKAGVTRGTVYNWTHHNERFMAALETWQRDMTKATRSRLLGLSGIGYRALAVAMDEGDAKVALAMFKGLGVLDDRRGGEEMDGPIKLIRRRSGVDRGGGGDGDAGE